MEGVRRIVFGPYTLDLRARELRKHDVRLRIRQQPFEILLMLLEKPGEVVLREDIRLRLWPDNTVVEFEHSINTAVQKLRDALGESASAPQFIETIPRRGYRFLGTVDQVERDMAAAADPMPELRPVPLPAGPGPFRGGRYWRLTLIASLVLALAAGAWVVVRKPDTGRKLVVPVATNGAVVSPDGHAVVWGDAGGLVVRRFDAAGAKRVAATPPADTPTWAPDGSQVAVATAPNIYRVRLSNGETSLICPRPGPSRGLTWSRNGTLLFAAWSGGYIELFSVPVTGGTPAQLMVPGFTEGFFFEPEFLPDGERFLFAWSRAEDEEAGLYLASLKGGRVTAPVLLQKSIVAGRYSESNGGELLWLESDNLYAQHLSLQEPARLSGERRKVLEGVHSTPGMRRPSLSVSRNGGLVWTAGHANASQLTWFDRHGRVLATAGRPIEIDFIRIAPDGTHILATPAIGPTRIVETGRDGYQPVTGADRGLWTPDGAKVIHSEYRASGDRIVERDLGTGQKRELFSQEGRLLTRDLSPDGKIVLFVANRSSLQYRRIDGAIGAPHQFLDRGSPQAKFSPDGKWVVYLVGGEHPQLYVQAFPSGALRTQITTDGGADPVWRGDGKEIIFRWNSSLYSVRVEINGTQFKAGEPELLFRIRAPRTVASSEIAGISKDGSRILFAQSTLTDYPPVVYMMTSWGGAGP